MIALYAFATYRLMPHIQSVYAGVSTIRANEESLNVLYEDLHTNVPSSSKNSTKSKDQLSLKKAIELKHISFAYQGDSKLSLREVNMTIPANSTVGIVGTTGAGKTTSADILLGLLQPSQ